MYARHLQSRAPPNSRPPRSSLSLRRSPPKAEEPVDSSEAPEAPAVQSSRENTRRSRVQTVRALVAAHHADVANGTSEDNILTLMIDSNGNYVGSATSKANIVARVAPSGDTVVAMGAGGARGGGGGGWRRHHSGTGRWRCARMSAARTAIAESVNPAR